MHIFRWLMSHPIVTAWILAAIAILLNLNMGAGGHKEKHAADKSGAAHEVVVDAGMPVVDTKSESTQHVEASHEPKAVSFDAGHKAMSEQPSGQADSGMSNNAVNSAMTAGSVSEETQLVNADQAATTSIHEEVSLDGLDSMNSQDLLQLARESFWQNNKEKSVAIYQALIKRDSASLLYKGELANVYWHQNKQKESAALYAEIAVPMIEEGKTNEVSNMLGFIGVFFPEKSLELQKLMAK
jgi:hypothetical protein